MNSSSLYTQIPLEAAVPTCEQLPFAAAGSPSEDGLFLLQAQVQQALEAVESNAELAELCLTQFMDHIPAEGFAVHHYENLTNSQTKECFSSGRCPLNQALTDNLAEILHVSQATKPIMINELVSGSRSWPFPEVRQAVVRRICSADRDWGYLVVFNQVQNQDFSRQDIRLIETVISSLERRLTGMEQRRKSEEAGLDLIESLLKLMQSKDPVTYHHSLRVAATAVVLAEVLGYCSADRRTIYLGGLVHDLGKLAIHEAVLNKPGKLTVPELHLLRQHPQFGHEMLRFYEPMQALLPIVLYHHEQPDGGGYPLGLVGESIPWQARLIAVADSYDALTRDRPYRRGMSHKRATRILIAGRGTQWDPTILDAFLEAETMIDSISPPLEFRAHEGLG